MFTFMTILGYQFLLSKRSYAVYIFTKDASSFFSSNKIGIFSLIGTLGNCTTSDI